MEAEDIIKLGGGIELIGFRQAEPGSMIIVKKIIGSCARKLSDDNEGFELLRCTLDGEKITSELVISGKSKVVEAKDPNVFVALDKALKQL